MPKFEWNNEDMEHSLIFFPLVGGVIGGCLIGLAWIFRFLEFPGFAVAILLVLLPVLITGGFHLDGFMDTKDALSSYAPKEKKLEILKDPHVGSFAIIGLVVQLLFTFLGVGLMLEAERPEVLIVYGISFVISRCLSGLSSLYLPKAKKDGMLVLETGHGSGGKIAAPIIVWMVLATAGAFFTDWKAACVMAGVSGLVFLYYKSKMIKEFGGVTGDTAGFLVVVTETAVSLALGFFVRIPF